MKKRDIIRSFQDIDSSRFPGKTGVAGIAGKTDFPPETADNLEADSADESALFLEAVAGTLDVSMKNPAMPVAESREEETPSPAFGVAVPHVAKQKETAPSLMRKKPTGPGGPDKPAPLSCEEERLFLNAMDGVAPVRAGGRDLAPPAKPAGRAKPADMTLMDDIFTGKLEFSLEYTEEFVQGHVLGLDPVVLAKLRSGAYSPEGHLDLHGQNLEQAYASLAIFLKTAYQNGKRHVLVITGRGKNSPGGTPVLRERVQAWFTREPFKRVVLAFCTAKPGDGGAGALYLLLRKRKKSQGKIVWDRMPSEEELLL